MKKLLTTLFLATSAVIVTAQSFQILDKTTGLPVTTKTIYANPTQNTTTKFSIKNLTNSAKEFKVKMKVTSGNISIASQSLQFCDQINCLYPEPNGEAISSDPNPIAANQTLGATGSSFGFVTYLDPIEGTDISGTYVVTFDVFNDADANDKATVTVTYRAYVGIEENLALNYKIGNAYPSPASENVFIDYNFASQPKTATLELYNVVGVKVNELNIEGTEGKIKMDVSTLSNGVYFYSLLVDGEKVSTKKVVIAD